MFAQVTRLLQQGLRLQLSDGETEAHGTPTASQMLSLGALPQPSTWPLTFSLSLMPQTSPKPLPDLPIQGPFPCSRAFHGSPLSWNCPFILCHFIAVKSSTISMVLRTLLRTDPQPTFESTLPLVCLDIQKCLLGLRAGS